MFLHWICRPYAINLKKVIDLDHSKIYIIMDNSPIHWSGKVKDYFIEKNISCIFLPQYSQELAPVELFFGQVKKLISTWKTSEVIHLEKELWIEALAEVIASISRIDIIRIWDHFISSLKHIVTQLDSILNQIT